MPSRTSKGKIGLVLSRHIDEAIMIGDDIEITIVDVRGGRVCVGIDAPPHVAVHRKEIYRKIQRENATAANLSCVEAAPVGSLAKHKAD